MNPFALESNYDAHLAEILAKVSKSSSTSINDALNDLLKYLPSSNYHSDYKIILKTLLPHFSSNGKLIINKIVYFLAKKLGIDVISSIQIHWLYENIESDDQYSMKIINEYLDISKIADEFGNFLKWEDPLKDLICFRFLIQKDKSEHVFDVSKLNLQCYLEFDVVFDILNIIKSRNPIEIMAVTANEIIDKESKTMKFLRDLFERILNVSNSLFINKKYKILLDIFNYFDDSIYHDSLYFEAETLSSLIKTDISLKKIKHDQLILKSVEQLKIVLPYVSNKEEFILKNIKDSMCFFELVDNFNLTHSIIIENIDRFKDLIENSIKKHFITKLCSFHSQQLTKLSDNHKEMLKNLYSIFNGKYQIIVASLLNIDLDPSMFDLKEIDEVMEYSVRVFAADYFFRETFSSSGLYFIRHNSEIINNLIRNDQITTFFRSFPNTKPEHVSRYIDETDILRIYLGTLPKDEIKKLCFLNTIPNLKLAYLFYLRDEIEQFSVNYDQVFEFFFQIDFLKYLINRNNNISGFIESSLDYIKKMEFKNSVFYNEFNFDTDTSFYYNLGLPEKDKILKILYTVLLNCKLDLKLEFLLYIVEIMIFVSVNFSEKFKKIIKNPEEQAKLREIFNLDDKNFLVERILNESAGFNTKVKQSTLFINPKKAVDVLLRSLMLNRKYLCYLNPNYLSQKALKNVIKSICSPDLSNFQWINTINIDFDDESIETKMMSIDLSSQVNESSNKNIEKLLDAFFNKKEADSVHDFLYLIENDDILQSSDFRSERLSIYEPYIDSVSTVFSEIFINMYSIAKLESSNDNEVFELILEPLKDLKRTFWMILSHTLHRISNVYISFFIEKILIRYLDDSNSNFLNKNNIINIREYLQICNDKESNLFAFVLPNMYSKLNIKKILDFTDLIKPLENTKIDGGKISYSTIGNSHKLRFVYRADSLVHEAIITVPSGYPLKKPKIEFDGSMKNLKFYHKLNEMLCRTSKFVEIFMLWKVDIDNHLMGYSECLICYFIMEPKYRTLPEFKCSVCKNAFHDKCIYKWAAESKKRACPFCRSELPLWENTN